jgi:phosphatidylglycerol lysyltransferase
VLVASRREFYRKAAFTTERFSAGWIALIAIVLVCSIWLGMFSYEHVEYSSELWWQFALYGEASRFMRATVGVIIFLLLYAGFELLAPGRPVSVALDVDTVGTIDAIVKASKRTNANLAFLGDKQFVLNEKKNTFIMYGVEGRSWVAMGEPVGPEDEWEDLAWKFIELSDQYDGRPVFYQVQGQHLEFYTDLGLTFIKLGEEAQVDLASFSLEGNAHKSLRYTHNKIKREDYAFEIVPQEQTAGMLEVLKQISDTWLAGKSTREKGFSLGNFSPEYFKRFPAALVRRDEQIIAFANIWMGAEKEELSVDLMRYLPDSPDGIMDYMFTELLLWGKQEGYQWFNFGMAPLSGLDDRALAPFWSKAGSLIFRHGEHFYNFQGLRRYKDKFGPKWQAMYLACRGGFALPRILVNVASLISGGLKGTVMK